VLYILVSGLFFASRLFPLWLDLSATVFSDEFFLGFYVTHFLTSGRRKSIFSVFFHSNLQLLLSRCLQENFHFFDLQPLQVKFS